MSSEEGTTLTRSVIRFVSETASFPNLRLKHTQYEGIAPPDLHSTLITLKAEPDTEDNTKQIPAQNTDDNIPVSNADDSVNPSQDKGGIEAERKSYKSQNNSQSKSQNKSQKSSTSETCC